LAQSSTGVEYRAASAIDIALWDILGRATGQPVHTLLGGCCRERVRIYNTCVGYKYVRTPDIRPVSTWNLDETGPYEDLEAFIHRPAELAESLLAQGITGMKVCPFDVIARRNGGLSISAAELRQAIQPIELIRRAVGDSMDIMIEFHSLWNLPAAKKIARALEPYSPAWFEDPLVLNSPQALAEFARSTSVPICAGETLGSRWPYKEMFDKDAIDIAMVDLCWTGGLTEGRKIAALADTYHRPFAPHDCTGPIGFATAIHASFSQPNTLIQESVRAFYTGWYGELVTSLPHIKDGFVYPMVGPGLGTELRPEVFERDDLSLRSSLF
jgi:L-alanine-DL-glutamate epimerase-like enolase superfamily enzyme